MKRSSVCLFALASTPLEHWGGGSQVARRTRESRRRRRRGSGVWEGAVPLPRKFMNFSSQNGVISLIWCMVFRSSAEGKKITGRPLQVKYWGAGRDSCNLCGVDAYVCLSARPSLCPYVLSIDSTNGPRRVCC